MNTSLSELLDLSIAHEINISRLYTLFHELFEEDEEFWWQLSIEERNHAALLRNEKNIQKPSGLLPENLLTSDLKALQSSNAELETLIAEYKTNPPSRQDAFQTAYDLEQSVGEIHYQEFMNRKSCSLSDELFKQLNLEDKDHADRIQSYMLEHGIPFREKD
ncbi:MULTISPECIES: rubrerythrin family protein [Prosthecochloris]|uniref:Rubrerythrin family protein n=1 Tax=Prosthecochloris marina TaxID=2017681 RepID=A0A317T5N5_9CHLB|nr:MULTISPECIES: rubrerythrin family protein [Prosthecochloris]PWW81027.1 rubrerythrin family protein [Prosthecochloris marina]UZJ36905.1 rubrerythrin family protein [Prosthecochloris sp. SCSIO W1103]UZJ39847.1 rubrerythrin family protein [Prosthecochloris sp. SCSIO W1102]